MDRIAQLQQDAVDGLVVVNVATYYPYQQERLPYWTNQVQAVAFTRDAGEDVEVRVYTIQMRLILAHRGENYDGATFDTAYDIIPAVLDTFEDHLGLTSSVHSEPLDAVFGRAGYHGVEITAVSGPAIFTNAGIMGNQIGLQFTLTLPIIRQRY